MVYIYNSAIWTLYDRQSHKLFTQTIHIVCMHMPNNYIWYRLWHYLRNLPLLSITWESFLSLMKFVILYLPETSSRICLSLLQDRDSFSCFHYLIIFQVFRDVQRITFLSKYNHSILIYIHIHLYILLTLTVSFLLLLF